MRRCFGLLVLVTSSACAHDDGTAQELSRLRREVHALRRTVEETRADVERVEKRVDGMKARTAKARSSKAPEALGQRETPSLPVVRLSTEGQTLDVDAGAVDDGSPPILIKMGPDPSAKIPVNEQVLRRRDPVLSEKKRSAGGADIEDEYQAALRTLRERNDAAAALALFRAFESAHPGSSYADNAAYWAGEAQMGLEDWDGAILSFRRVLEDYPRSSKRPYALLRMGQSLLSAGRVDAGRARLGQVLKDYPSSEPAEEARALLDGAEQRNL